MSMSKQHLERRKKYLGASEIAAVLGVSPWKNALDVYLEKTGQVVPFEGNADTDRGNRLERSVLDWAADELGVKIRANQWRVHTNRVHAATLDAVIPARPREAMEAKTTKGGDWGEPGTDQVPDHVLIQAQQQALVADLEVVWVPVLTTGLDFALYRVERNQELVDVIRERGEEFWQEHVLPGIPPADLLPSLDTLKRIKRDPVTVPLARELYERYEAASRALREAETERDEAKAEVLHALGNADAGQCELGVIKFQQQKTAKFDKKRLRAEHPDIYEKYASEGTRLMPYIKPAQEDKEAA